MLQNQAQSLINQAKNLTTISFPELQALKQTMQQIDQLMGQAQGIQFKVASLDQQFRSLLPRQLRAKPDHQPAVAKRPDADGYRACGLRADHDRAGASRREYRRRPGGADGIVARSQSAEGALQASQATNQLSHWSPSSSSRSRR
jgi:P-type conjugative transfer protein TrbJ